MLIIVTDRVSYMTRGTHSSYPQLGFSLSFLDPKAGLLAAQHVSPRQSDKSTRVMIECGTMYEAVRPFLESLQGLDPGRVPMSRYLVGGKQETDIRLPEYTTKPGFRWNLQSLLGDAAKADGVPCSMNPNDRSAVTNAGKELKEEGKLDPR